MSNECLNEAVGIKLSGIHKQFANGLKALENVNLIIQPGDLAVFIGPSGCGKTTLLRMLGCLDHPSKGSIEVVCEDGNTHQYAPTDVAFCFQEPRLLPWRSALSNVALPLELKGVPAPTRSEQAHAALEIVGLSHAHHLKPHQLSGGMQMRVSLARALVTQPKILLLDEPFGALDEISRAHLDDELLRLWSSLKMTVCLVTHSLAEAVYVGHTVHVMSSHPGTVVDSIVIDLPERNASIRSSSEFSHTLAHLNAVLHSGSKLEKMP